MTTGRSLSSTQVARAAQSATGTAHVSSDQPSVLIFSMAAAPSWEQAESQRMTARLLRAERWRFETLSSRGRIREGRRGYCFPAGMRAALMLSHRLRRMVPRFRGVQLVACPYSPLVVQLTLPLVLGRFYGVPVIVDLRFGIAEDAVLSPGRSTRKILSLAETILVDSETPAVHLSHLGLPAMVAPLAVDGERFQSRVIDKVQPRILARLPASGPDEADRTALQVLRKAFDMVKCKYPRTELRILCDHGGMSIDQSNDHPGIRVDVAVHDDDVIRAYEWADVFVNPAIMSASPIALAHAMACGLPVVSTRGGGAAELLQAEEAGFLIRAGQPGELADRIIDLVKRPGLARKMSLSAARRGKTLQAKAQADSWLRLYRRALAI